MSHLRDPTRLASISPRPSRSSPSLPGSSASATAPPRVVVNGSGTGGPSSPSASTSRERLRRRSSASSSSASKENEPIIKSVSRGVGLTSSMVTGSSKMNGRTVSPDGIAGQVWRDGSLEPEDPNTTGGSDMRKRYITRRTKSPSPATATSNGGPASPRSPSKHSASPSSASASATATGSYYNGLPTLPPISDDPDCAITDSPTSEKDLKPPPPAPSAATGTGNVPVTRKRRSSSIKRKLSPGARPVKVVDWEIPRKTLHSSIGFLALFLYHLDPPSVLPLTLLLSASLVVVVIADYLRFSFPTFRELWEQHFGFLMRESERDKINGVVWYLVGVVFVLSLYPREVAVVSILTLSWSDTTASTIGRLWGRYTPPLPAHLPLIPQIKFAPRKSLAGFLAAAITGAAICTGFWWAGSYEGWKVLNGGWVWKGITAGVVGLGGAVVEALGAIIWAWLSLTQLLLA